MDDESSFFQNRPWGEAIYMALKESILNSFPLLDVRVQKTQITLSNSRVFSCVLYESDEEERRKGALPCLDPRSLPSSQFSQGQSHV